DLCHLRGLSQIDRPNMHSSTQGRLADAARSRDRRRNEVGTNAARTCEPQPDSALVGTFARPPRGCSPRLSPRDIAVSGVASLAGMAVSAIDTILGPSQPPSHGDEQNGDSEALDAYSRAVTGVAERLAPSVGNLRVSRRVRGGRMLDGGGSSVVVTPDGFMLTSAHVVARTDGTGRASFVDGRELDFDVV